MSCWKFEYKYIMEVYFPERFKKDQGNGAPGVDFAHINNLKLRQAYDSAWEAMWREVDAFWVRSGAALLLLGGASSLLFEEGMNYFESAIVSLGVLFMVIVWRQINLGSIAWMRSWMTHVDLMENGVTGPVFKTVFHKHTHSTTKSISHLSMLGVWLATANAFYQLQRAISCCLDGFEAAHPGFLCESYRMILISVALIMCAGLIVWFISLNISYTDDSHKEMYLRKITRTANPQEKQGLR